MDTIEIARPDASLTPLHKRYIFTSANGARLDSVRSNRTKRRNRLVSLDFHLALSEFVATRMHCSAPGRCVASSNNLDTVQEMAQHMAHGKTAS